MMYRSERPDKGTIVYVGGLVGDVKKEDLEAEFGKFGKLSRVWVAFNPPGFAFVEFTNKNDAEAAVDALHNASALGSKLRVEISRGRGRGGRGGVSGRGGGERGPSGNFSRGGRGVFRGGRGEFMGGRSNDFGQGMGGLSRGRGGFGGNHQFEEDYKPFRGSDLGNRFDDFEDRRRSEFDDRDFGAPRDFGRRDIGVNRHYGDEPARGFSGLDRNYDNVSGGRGFGAGGRDVAARDFGGRDFAPRDVENRDYGVVRDARGIRDFGGRNYGNERDINGARNFGASHDLPLERGYGAERDIGPRDFGVSQVTLGRDFGDSRDVAPVRDIGEGREYGGRDLVRDYVGSRDIGLRRDSDIRDYNPPRDQGDLREFAGRPSRIDYAENNRFGASGRGGFGNGDVRRSGGFDAGRYSGGDTGGTGDYGSYGARDRFRSRSPIGRVSHPMY